MRVRNRAPPPCLHVAVFACTGHVASVWKSAWCWVVERGLLTCRCASFTLQPAFFVVQFCASFTSSDLVASWLFVDSEFFVVPSGSLSVCSSGGTHLSCLRAGFMSFLDARRFYPSVEIYFWKSWCVFIVIGARKENYAGSENHCPYWLRKRKPLRYPVP